mmetsp:Transcript_15369/g.36710  ORF Transcript_15369/g.36710 Transcript_15369/m.36710 type:complete len:96 (-) Transcript_15369:25-312(-)
MLKVVKPVGTERTSGRRGRVPERFRDPSVVLTASRETAGWVVEQDEGEEGGRGDVLDDENDSTETEDERQTKKPRPGADSDSLAALLAAVEALDE